MSLIIEWINNENQSKINKADIIFSFLDIEYKNKKPSAFYF